MRATIDVNGKLEISAETGIEAYALRRWWEEYMSDSDSKRVVLAVCYDIDLPREVVKTPSPKYQPRSDQ